jgi:hypothetical protein
MKHHKLLFIFLVLLISRLTLFGQNTEYQISLNSGLFSYSGNATKQPTFFHYNDVQPYKYVENPVSNKNNLGYGISGNMKRITKPNIIMGFDLGYEVFENKTPLNGVIGQLGLVSASGQVSINTQSINLHPFLGYRLQLVKTKFDITSGLDIGHRLNDVKANVNILYSNGKKEEYVVDDYIQRTKTDVRFRIQVASSFKRWGIYAGYSLGLSKYDIETFNKEWNSAHSAYSGIIRFGITYQINYRALSVSI